MKRISNILVSCIKEEDKSLEGLTFLSNEALRKLFLEAAISKGCPKSHFFSAACLMLWNCCRNVTTKTLGYDAFRLGHHIFVFGPPNVGKNNTLSLVSEMREYGRNLAIEYLIKSNVKLIYIYAFVKYILRTYFCCLFI